MLPAPLLSVGQIQLGLQEVHVRSIHWKCIWETSCSTGHYLEFSRCEDVFIHSSLNLLPPGKEAQEARRKLTRFREWLDKFLGKYCAEDDRGADILDRILEVSASLATAGRRRCSVAIVMIFHSSCKQSLASKHDS